MLQSPSLTEPELGMCGVCSSSDITVNSISWSDNLFLVIYFVLDVRHRAMDVFLGIVLICPLWMLVFGLSKEGMHREMLGVLGGTTMGLPWETAHGLRMKSTHLALPVRPLLYSTPQAWTSPCAGWYLELLAVPCWCWLPMLWYLSGCGVLARCSACSLTLSITCLMSFSCLLFLLLLSLVDCACLCQYSLAIHTREQIYPRNLCVSRGTYMSGKLMIDMIERGSWWRPR